MVLPCGRGWKPSPRTLACPSSSRKCRFHLGFSLVTGQFFQSSLLPFRGADTGCGLVAGRQVKALAGQQLGNDADLHLREVLLPQVRGVDTARGLLTTHILGLFLQGNEMTNCRLLPFHHVLEVPYLGR